MNEHLEQPNVFRFPPLFKEFTYAEAFCAQNRVSVGAAFKNSYGWQH